MNDPETERLELERQKRVTQLKRSGQWRLLAGGLLCVTVIGAIIGLPLGISGYQKLRRAKQVKRGEAV